MKAAQYKGKTKNTIKFEINNQIGGHFKVSKFDKFHTFILPFDLYDGQMVFVFRVSKTQNFAIQLNFLGWKRIKGVKYACYSIADLSYFLAQFGIEFNADCGAQQNKRVEEMALALRSPTNCSTANFEEFAESKEMTSFNESNFFLASKVDFKPCQAPNRKPDYISDSGSKYWYEKGGVIRSSDHWGYVASCYWTIGGAFIQNCLLAGFAYFHSFQKNHF